MTEQPPNDSGQQPWQPPPQPAPPPGFGTQYSPEPPATSRATTALVLGIVGLTVCVGIASIPAWIIGNEALKEIDNSNGALGGRSFAQAGKVMGIIGTALGALSLLVLGLFLVLSLAVFSSVDCSGTTTDTEFSFNC
jgi:hypothetical protein